MTLALQAHVHTLGPKRAPSGYVCFTLEGPRVCRLTLATASNCRSFSASWDLSAYGKKKVFSCEISQLPFTVELSQKMLERSRVEPRLTATSLLQPTFLVPSGQTPSNILTLSLPRMSNFACSLTRKITSHSMENLAFHSLLIWKMIILYHFSLPHVYIFSLIQPPRPYSQIFCPDAGHSNGVSKSLTQFFFQTFGRTYFRVNTKLQARGLALPSSARHYVYCYTKKNSTRSLGESLPSGRTLQDMT